MYTVRLRVTACSPRDPKDLAYYAKYGYEGDAYGIAAYTRDFPKGTLMRVPGYRQARWEDVDSSGGSVIRRSARAGIKHIDVKFRTLYSVRQWGSQWLDVKIYLPEDASEAQHAKLAKMASSVEPAWVRYE